MKAAAGLCILNPVATDVLSIAIYIATIHIKLYCYLLLSLMSQGSYATGCFSNAMLAN